MKALSSSILRRANKRTPADEGRTYRAFISYSHSADGKLAPTLQSALQQFAKPWYKLRAIRVFRDDSTLAVTDQLWTSIAQALASSDFFIVLASPPAAKSEWVGREISFWLQERSVETLLLALTEGELVWSDVEGRFDAAKSTAVPPALAGAFVEEPRWVDLRFARGSDELSLKHPQFSDAVADLAARLHGRPKDEIAGEDVRQHRKSLRIARSAAATLAVLAVAATVLGLLARDQRDEARAQRDVAESRSFAIQSRTSLGAGRLADAFSFAVNSYDKNPTSEARDAVLAALSAGVRLVTMRRGPRATAAAFTKDGRTVAVAAESGDITLWDLTRRRATRTIASRQPVNDLAFAPDGRSLAATHEDGKLRVWDLDRPGAQPTVVTPSDHRPIGGSVAFGPGPTVAWSVGRVTLAVWNGEGRDARALLTTSTFFSQQPWNVALSSDGTTIAAGGQDNGDLFFDATSEAGQFEPPSAVNVGSGVSSLAFLGTTRLVLVGAADGKLSVWDADTHTRAGEPFDSQIGAVEQISPDPASPRLLLFGTRGVALVYLTTRAGEVDVFPSYSSDLGGAFVGNSGVAATVGRDGVVAFWRIGGSRLQLGRTLDTTDMQRVAFADDGASVAAAGGKDVIVWSVPDGKMLLRKPLSETPGAVAFGPGGDTVFVGSDVKAGVTGWNVSTGRTLEQALPSRAENLSVFAISARGDRPLAAIGSSFTRTVIAAQKIVGVGGVAPGTAGRGAPMHLWEMSGQRDLGQVAVPRPDNLTSAWLSRDGRLLATLTSDGELLLWNTDTRERLARLPGTIRAAAFSDDGDEIVAATNDGIGVWSTESPPRRIGDMFSSGRGLWTVLALGGGDRILAAADEAGAIRLWDYESRRLMGQVDLYDGGTFGREAPELVLSPDGKRLAAVTRRGEVVLFDIDPESWVARACRVAGLDVEARAPRRCR